MSSKPPRKPRRPDTVVEDPKIRKHAWLANRVREQLKATLRLDVPRGVCDAMVDALVASMKLAVESGDRVQLDGFGTFQLQRRAPRVGRDPRNATPLQIPASIRCNYKMPAAWGDHLTLKYGGTVEKPFLQKLARERWLERAKTQRAGEA